LLADVREFTGPLEYALGELRRITLLRGWVNKGKRKAGVP
jgi:hypothetical protein